MTKITDTDRAEKNMRLQRIIIDGMNSRDWDIFDKHHAKDVVVRWPGGQPPTIGRGPHRKENEDFLKAFPDNYIEGNPFKILFGQGDWTCAVNVYTATHTGPLIGFDGRIIPPTNKKFKVDLYTIARWNDRGEIVEEDILYDQIGVYKQLGIM
jgi:hypothetical protein